MPFKKHEIPVGSGMIWYTSTAPGGWLICNGAAVSRSTYSALFAILGTTYGVGDGSTTFNLPNLSGRYPVGVVTTLAATAGTALTDNENRAVGQHTHTFTGNALGNHTHTTHDEVNRTGAGGIFTTVKFGINEADQGTLLTGTASAGTPSGTNANAGTVAGTNAPYIQIYFIIKT